MTKDEYAEAIEAYLTYKIDKHEVPLDIPPSERVEIAKAVFTKLGLQ